MIYSMADGAKCGLEWAGGEASSGNERKAKWDCKGNADPVIIEGDKIYSMVDGAKCGLEWVGGDPGSGNEREAKWDCKGNADTVTIEAKAPTNL